MLGVGGEQGPRPPSGSAGQKAPSSVLDTSVRGCSRIVTYETKAAGSVLSQRPLSATGVQSLAVGARGRRVPTGACDEAAATGGVGHVAGQQSVSAATARSGQTEVASMAPGAESPAAPRRQAPELWALPAGFRRAPQTSFAPRNSPRETQSVSESRVVSGCSNIFFFPQKVESQPLRVTGRRAAPRAQRPRAPGDPRDGGFRQEVVFSGTRFRLPSKTACVSVAGAGTDTGVPCAFTPTKRTRGPFSRDLETTVLFQFRVDFGAVRGL